MNNSISLELVRWIENVQLSNDLAKNFSLKNLEGTYQISDDYTKQTLIENLGLSEEEFNLRFVESGLLSPSAYPKSKYQNRSYHHMYTLLWDNVDSITRICYPKAHKTFPVEVASAYIGDINARIRQGSNKSEFAIIIDEAFLAFSNLLSRIYIQVIPFIKQNNGSFFMSLNDSDIENRINASDNKSFIGFFDLIKSLIIEGLPCAAEQYYQPSYREVEGTSAVWIKHCFDLFLMAHEYGHMHLNHFEDDKFEKESYKAKLLSRVCELEADRFAMEIVIRDSLDNKMSPFFAIVGALIFFEYQLFIERCLYFFQFGKDMGNEPSFSIHRDLEVGMSTHPHAFIRKEYLLKFLKNSDLHQTRFIDVDDIEKFFNKVLNIFWNKSFNAFKYYYDQKIMIHPIWKRLSDEIIANEKEFG